MEDGTYSKKSNNVRETYRVQHIKEKKDRLRQEQIEREEERQRESNKKKEGDIVIDEEFGKKNKKKSRKKKNEISDSD